MFTSTYPIIILSDSDIEDSFSSINTPDYTPTSLDYSPASQGNTSSDPSEDLSKDLSASLTISPFHDDPYMKVMQAYNATNNESPIPLPQAPIVPPTVLPPYLVFKIGESTHATLLECHEKQIVTILNHLDELPLERIEHVEDKIEGLGKGRREKIRHDDEIVLAHVRITTLEILIEDIQHMIPSTPPSDTEPPIGSPIPLSLSSSVGSSSPIRSTTPPPEYPFDESIFAELDNSLWIIPRPLKSEPIPEEPNDNIKGCNGSPEDIKSAHTTYSAPLIKKLVANSVVAAIEAQAATMANTDNTTRNTRQRETPIARKCSYKEFKSCQPFNFKGTEGVVGLIRWFKRTKSLFLYSNYTEDCKVKFATGTLTEEALSWWNSFAQPIRIEEAYKISWSEFKKLLIKKYCPRTESEKEDELSI
ncbi:hypothetical protein Tco_0936948 [Tanacetum coccineum]|uniref:Reverse transcriptase domain-containing protein n=1 Tax=Tanacetum coccineum TaxID=301880 RepID=A0ABQ5DET2_9ASTR